MTYDVAVIGGGILGCASAYYLAKAGASVVVLERGRVGEGATGASAGMLAPVAEAKQPGPFLDLVVAALRDYPSAVREVEEASGLSSGYNQRSILRVAFTPEDEAKFQNALPMYDLAGLPYHRLTGDEARREEPALGPGAISAIFSPEEGQVLPRQLVLAYRYAAEMLGARILEDTEALDVVVNGERATGVRTLAGTVEAETVLVANGAWAVRFEAALHQAISVYPVRGQIVALRSLPAPVKHVLYSYIGYAVPWPDGRLICGATQEEVGYAPHTTVDGVMQVLDGARRLVPGARLAEIDSTWAGLRPGSPDTMPLLGPAEGWRNVWLATGHFRNGVLLGPYTARHLASSIISGRLVEELIPFHPSRPS